MPLKALKNFQSLKTQHCVTGSMRQIYAFHQHPVSEEMLLGLGAGVGFIYWHMRGTPPFLGGRANVGRPGEAGLERLAGWRTGVWVGDYTTSSLAKAEKTLLDLLLMGEPVMLQVDMGYLPYFKFPQEYHFGGHMVVAAGYEAQTRRVLLADRDAPLHPVALDDLARARSSRFKPFPPKNHWFVFDFRQQRPPRPEEAKGAIREAARSMLTPPIANLGVRGIRKAAQAVRQWPRQMSPADLELAGFNVYIMIDARGGTGGGLFRYMYARFLQEVAALTAEPAFAEAGAEMQAIGDDWQKAAQLFRKITAERLPAAAERLEGIAEKEQAVWEKLAGLVKQP